MKWSAWSIQPLQLGTAAAIEHVSSQAALTKLSASRLI